MTLLKRLALDRTSELFEKCPLPPRGDRGKVAVGGKRWRLSPIKEQGDEACSSSSCSSGNGVKRRRIDSEMAEKMTNALWISEAAEREMAEKLDGEVLGDTMTPDDD